jgi:hypothetical protein
MRAPHSVLRPPALLDARLAREDRLRRSCGTRRVDARDVARVLPAPYVAGLSCAE